MMQVTLLLVMVGEDPCPTSLCLFVLRLVSIESKGWNLAMQHMLVIFYIKKSMHCVIVVFVEFADA